MSDTSSEVRSRIHCWIKALCRDTTLFDFLFNNSFGFRKLLRIDFVDHILLRDFGYGCVCLTAPREDKGHRESYTDHSFNNFFMSSS